MRGTPTHRLAIGSTLVLATETGDWAVLDLSVFEQDCCSLLEEVWSESSSVWVDGTQVFEVSPASHPCAP